MMNTRKLTALCTAAAFAAIGFASPASAQATRTWVSGVGDDVNPCSRTAPCKTFAGAISKTAAGGEINCLDPGGFGAVTINKSLTIDCHFTEGGALAGGNGIVVNALSTDVVTIRGLDIFGVNPPSNGVRVLVAAAVHIEDCVIRRFNAANSYGISFQPSNAQAHLFVTNTTISQNGTSGSGGGILIQPTGTSIGRVSLDNVRVKNNNNFGINVDSTGNTGLGVVVVANKTESSGNVNTGINFNAGGAVIIGLVRDSTILFNSASGIAANGVGATIRVSNVALFNNSFVSGSAVNITGSATINTYADNLDDLNSNNGAFTLPALQRK
jgi:hypothetical protein